MSLSLKVGRANSGGRGRPGTGDPGVFGFLGGALKRVTGITKAVPGPIGWASGAVSKVLSQPRSARSIAGYRPQQQTEGIVGIAQRMIPELAGRAVPGIVGMAQRMIPGGATGYQPAVPEIGAPAGYHVNKTEYFLKDGTRVEAGTRWVKNRKRNPLNPRAASKAIGRIESLKKATARFSRITIRKKCCK